MGENYNREGQGELFPEFKASESRRFAYFKKEFAFGKKMVLNISWENLVLTAIVLIMLIALSFSFGVEKGKRLAIKNERVLAPVYSDKSQEKEPAAGLRAYPAESAPKAEEKLVGAYTIQIMALKKSDDIQKEIVRLNRAGYDAFAVSSGSWHHVCIGRYATPADANRDLRSIKQRYPDSYVRKIGN